MTSVKDRFLKYVRIETTSDRDVDTCPSSITQMGFAKTLADELKTMGLQEISLDDHCYLMATLPANLTKPLPVLGLIAHMDTSPDMSGKNVNPQIISNYDGGNIVLNKELGVVLDTTVFPEIKKYAGQELITTDGTTLLGVDDKAGIAEILTAIEYLMAHPEIKHGKIRIGFTPDEEIGRGADLFDVKKFGADFAYTIDGGEIGELEYETFNAAAAEVIIKGKNVHPGVAKNKMVNSILVGMEFNAMLPVNERPEFTEGIEGFAHIFGIHGTVEESRLTYIIRDHNRAIFEKRKKLFLQAGDFLNQQYGAGTITIHMKDQYYNMREKIEPVYHIVQLAFDAMKSLEIEPKIVPVRGGTDGSRLSFMGLPCPNIFTGGLYGHGKFECVPTKSMEMSVQVIVKICQMLAEK